MIQLGRLDGVPVLSTPGGPVAAGITFRVGYADEVLARSGITHLIEHLALYRLGVTNYHYNGTTEPLFTSFFSQGSAESVTTYLEKVCAALTDLPMDRLETEKDILRTEADSGKRGAAYCRVLLWRYGARGPGLAGLPEWGLPALGPDDLTAWVARYFTRENAVVWFTGMEVPDGLRLPLPSGVRQPAPVTPDVLPVTPAYFADLPQAIACQLPVPRTAAAVAAAQVLERELFRRLRQDGGYSYSISAGYQVSGATTGGIVAVADVAEDRQAAALGEFVDVLASLRWGKLDPAELEEIKAGARSDQANPLAEAGRVPREATNQLLGGTLEQNAALLAEVEALTPADIQKVFDDAADRALLLTPQGFGAAWAGFSRVPTLSDAPLAGQPVMAHGDPARSLVIGQEGVSSVSGGKAASVRFADCQAMLAWPDGARLLLAGDATSCTIEPTLFPLPPGALDYVDQRVPHSRVVRMPARAPGDIPVPPAPAAAPAASHSPAPARRVAAPGAPAVIRDAVEPRRARKASGASTVGIVILSVIGTLLALWAVFVTLLINAPDSNEGVLYLAILSWVPVVLCAVGVWALARRKRRG